MWFAWARMLGLSISRHVEFATVLAAVTNNNHYPVQCQPKIMIVQAGLPNEACETSRFFRSL